MTYRHALVGRACSCCISDVQGVITPLYFLVARRKNRGAHVRNAIELQIVGDGSPFSLEDYTTFEATEAAQWQVHMQGPSSLAHAAARSKRHHRENG